MDQVFDGKKPAKLGTPKRPAKINVHTEQRQKEIEAICDENDWTCEITVDSEKPEDTVELEILRNPSAPTKASPKVGRNEPCPCGSGKKFKKCCGS